MAEIIKTTIKERKRELRERINKLAMDRKDLLIVQRMYRRELYSLMRLSK